MAPIKTDKTTKTTKTAKVLMERMSYPHKIEMIYSGPAQLVSIRVTDTNDNSAFQITPEAPQHNLMDAYNHPFCEFWQCRVEVPAQ